MQKIARNVYVETGFRGCNVSFVVTKDGVVMIDTPQVPSEAYGWRDEIARHGTLRYLINNEPHSDHAAGNFHFKAPLIAHEGSWSAYEKLSVSMIEDMLKRIAPESLPMPVGYFIRMPDITFSQNMTLHVGDHTFQLILLPGHTPFQTATYVPEEKVVFTSDNVVGAQPFLHQALPFQWLESLKKIEDLDAQFVVPGHGPIGDKSLLPEMRKTLETWIRMVQDAIDKEMSIEQAQDKIRFEDYFPNAPADPFMKQMRRMMIKNVYEELRKR